MEQQNNDRNYRNNRRKARTRKRIRYGSMCFALCLLIAGTAFGVVNFLRGSESPPPPGNEIVTSNEGFFQEDRSQNETASPADSADSISVDVVAKNVVVMNADTTPARQSIIM